MKNLPKISIITVNYNKANFLEDTIKSVVNQKYGNLEYIIIDGASKDNSVEIIKKYEDHLSYWISEPDNGMTYALVKGFEKATGDIIAWLNSDDLFFDNTLNYVGKNFMKNKWDFFYGDMLLINKKGNKIKRVFSLDTNVVFYANGAISMLQPSCFWSKDIFDKVGGLDTSFKLRMDADLFTRIFSTKSVKVIRTNTVLSKFRIHEGQSHSWSSEDEYIREIDIVKNKYPINIFYKLMIKFKIYKILMLSKRIIKI